jgi:BirA family transcriptional regulator, biotin operon repressor / biotin---[acetyl-CoA-carboxylase] ligase
MIDASQRCDGCDRFGQVLTQHIVAEAVRAAGLPVPGRFLPVTGSTNTELFAMAEQGAPEWTLMVAGRQEAGRGRLGRAWISTEPGDSLLVSLLLRPRMSPSEAPVLSLLAAVCLVEACRDTCGVEVRCKWPNDLLVGERKIGGILAEATEKGGQLEYVVIGTGVNVGQRPDDFPGDLRDSATSVAIQGGRPDVPGLLRSYLVAMRRRYGAGRPGLFMGVLADYRRACDTVGRAVRATTVSGEQVEGTATGIGDGGELIVQAPTGPVSIAFGEVVHLD